MKAIFRLLLAAALALAARAPLHAQTAGAPPYVDYQGYVLGANGAPLAPDVSGAPAPINFTMEFRIWDASSSGTLIWGEKQTVTVSAGRFSVQLGKGTAITNAPVPPVGTIQNAFATNSRYVGVTVILPPATTGSEIAPRLQFLTSPFSFVAGSALSAGAVAQTTGSSSLNNTTLSGTTNLNGTTTIQSATISGGSATFSNATISAGSFTGTHSGNGSALTSLNASNISAGTLPLAQVPALPASIITSGLFSTARIPTLTTGHIPSLDASIISSGTFADALLPTSVARLTLLSSQQFSGPILFAAPVTLAQGVRAPAHRTTTHTEGAYLEWNKDGGGGSVYLLNQQGGGSRGGIIFGTVSSGNTVTEHMFIDNSGRVSIGANPISTNAGKGRLVITDTAGSNSISFTHYLMDNVSARSSGSVTEATSIFAAGSVHAIKFNAFSDARIKDVKGISDSATDLHTVLGLQVTDYTYKDTIARGSAPQKMLIAQQVEQVFPQAVARETDVVPDIYHKAAIKDGWITLPTTLKKGERVRLIASEVQGIHEVLEVDTGGTRFRTAFQPKGAEVFVYGREVDDFRSVDYHAIAMLNVSATQQIKKEKDAENKALTEKVAALEKRLQAEQKLTAGQDARLTTLEARDQARDRKLAALEALLLEHPQDAKPRPASLRLENRAE